MTVLTSLGTILSLLGTKISVQIPLCSARSENPMQKNAPKQLEVGQ